MVSISFLVWCDMLCTKVCSRLNSTSDGDAAFYRIRLYSTERHKISDLCLGAILVSTKIEIILGTPLERSCRNFRTASQETCGTRVKAVGLISTRSSETRQDKSQAFGLFQPFWLLVFSLVSCAVFSLTATTTTSGLPMQNIAERDPTLMLFLSKVTHPKSQLVYLVASQNKLG